MAHGVAVPSAYVIRMHETISACFGGKEKLPLSLKIRGVMEAIAVRGAPRASFSLNLEDMKNVIKIQLNDHLMKRPNPSEPSSFTVNLYAQPSGSKGPPLKLLRYESAESHKPIPLRVMTRWSVAEAGGGKVVQKVVLRALSNPKLQQDLSDVVFMVDSPSGAATFSSAEPAAAWRSDERQVCWRVSTFKRGEEMLFTASFTTTKEYAERRGNVSLQFSCSGAGATLTGVSPRLALDTDPTVVAHRVQRFFNSGEYVIKPNS